MVEVMELGKLPELWAIEEKAFEDMNLC